MRLPDHLTWLLRNLYAGQEATVRTRHATMDCFQIGEGVGQGCILSPYLFNLYASVCVCLVAQSCLILCNPMDCRLPGSLHHAQCQAGWFTSWIQNFQGKYQQPQTFRWYQFNAWKWRGTQEIKMKEESEKAGLKLNTQKVKIMISSPITSWQINGNNMERVTDFIFLGSKITEDSDCSYEIK